MSRGPGSARVWTLRRISVVAGLLLAAFVAGYGWQALEARRARAESRDLERRLHFQELATTLATAVLQTRAGRHESGRRLASEFFAGLRERVPEAAPEAREAFEGILRERDAVITALSRAEPLADEMLTRLFLRYRVANGGRDEGLPVPGSMSVADPALLDEGEGDGEEADPPGPGR